MASATSATLVIKPNACTNDPKRNGFVQFTIDEFPVRGSRGNVSALPPRTVSASQPSLSPAICPQVTLAIRAWNNSTILACTAAGSASTVASRRPVMPSAAPARTQASSMGSSVAALCKRAGCCRNAARQVTIPYAPQFATAAVTECHDSGDGRQPSTTRALAYVAIRFIASHNVFDQAKTHIIAIVAHANRGPTGRMGRVQEISIRARAPSGMANPMALCATPRRFGPTFSVTTSAAGTNLREQVAAPPPGPLRPQSGRAGRRPRMDPGAVAVRSR